MASDPAILSTAPPQLALAAAGTVAPGSQVSRDGKKSAAHPKGLDIP